MEEGEVIRVDRGRVVDCGRDPGLCVWMCVW